jgi:hypothetical protein
MASRREAPRASGALERHPIEACRRRGLELWELEHETLAPVLEFGRESDTLLIQRLGIPGAGLEERRPPRPAGPALLLQGVAAAAFFAAHDFPFAPDELVRARWDASEGSPRLWLARTPSGPKAHAPERPLPETIRRLLRGSSPAVSMRPERPRGGPSSGSLPSSGRFPNWAVRRPLPRGAAVSARRPPACARGTSVRPRPRRGRCCATGSRVSFAWRAPH